MISSTCCCQRFRGTASVLLYAHCSNIRSDDAYLTYIVTHIHIHAHAHTAGTTGLSDVWFTNITTVRITWTQSSAT